MKLLNQNGAGNRTDCGVDSSLFLASATGRLLVARAMPFSLVSSVSLGFARARLLGLVVGVCLALNMYPAQGQITLTVSQDGSGMNVSVLNGAVFTATSSFVGNNVFFGVTLKNLLIGNTVVQTSFNEQGSFALNGRKTNIYNGTLSHGGRDATDLVLGFDAFPEPYSQNDQIPLGPGSVKIVGVNYNFTELGSNGTAYLFDVNGTVLTDSSVTWTLVPEPETYAAITGLVCVGLVVFRRSSRPRVTV